MRYLYVLIGLMISVNASAQVSIHISNEYSAIHYNNQFKLGPNETEPINLPWNDYNDDYFAYLSVQSGSMRVFVLDNRDILKNNPEPKFLFDKKVTDYQEIALPKIPSPSGSTIVFHNIYNSFPVEASITIFRIGHRSAEDAKSIKKEIEIVVKGLEIGYYLPKFKITVEPCGMQNAISNPDIIICTELLGDLYDKDFGGALIPILLHEMAHSLLYLWKLPGYDNEDLADEFAALYLTKYPPRYLEDYIKWLEKRDPIKEFIIKMRYGDRHTISIQRARNIKEAMLKNDELVLRWSNLMAPFRKKME